MSLLGRAEVLVVGGGIAGVSAAWHLAARGLGVILLERRDVAAEASGLNAGSIDAAGWGAAPDLHAHLTMGSLEIFQALQLELGHDIEFRQSGSLQVIQTEEHLAYARRLVEGQRRAGLRADLLGPRDLRSLEPEANPALLGAIHWPLRAQADPVKATRALAGEAARVGARILTGHEVTGLGADGSGCRAVTAAGDVLAQALVLAAGPWCAPLGRMLGLDIPIVPVRGQMWATAPLSPRVFHVISSVESALHWSREPGGDGGAPPRLTHRDGRRVTRHLYGRQCRDGAVIVGGDRQQAGYDPTPDPDGIAVNHAHASEALPFLAEVSRARTWAGLMPFSLDGQPLIGRLPGRDGLYIVGGLASSGFGRGPAAGRLLAELIDTGSQPVLAGADPARCVTESPGGVKQEGVASV